MNLPQKTLALAIAAAFVVSACGDKAEDAAAAGPVVIKIGHSAPLTGPQAHLGKDNESGVLLAIDEANAAGMEIGGKKVRFELVSEDDQADPRQATMVAQKLLDSHVVAVIGHMNSGTTIPASRVYADAGMLQISPSATNPKYTQQGYRTAFRVMANDVQQGSVLGGYAVRDLKAKTVAIIDDRTAYGQGLADEVQKAVEAAGGKVVVREYTNDKATDFTSILTRVKSRSPDVLFFGGMDAQAGPMARQIKSLGIQTAFLLGDGGCTTEFARLAGEAAPGSYCSLPGVPVDKMAGGTDFRNRFKAKFSADIQLYAPYAYDAVRVLVQAIKQADSTDTKRIQPELAKIQFQGISGPISFDHRGDLQNGAITLYRFGEGRWDAVTTVTGESAPAPAPAPAPEASPAPSTAKDVGASLDKATDAMANPKADNKSMAMDAVKGMEDKAKAPAQKF